LNTDTSSMYEDVKLEPPAQSPIPKYGPAAVDVPTAELAILIPFI